jgi:hypothetical protein
MDGNRTAGFTALQIAMVALLCGCRESEQLQIVPALPKTSGIATYAELVPAIRGAARHTGNPIISHGKAWDSRQVHFSTVMIDPADAAKLIMFYGGGSCYDNDYAIGRATATVAKPYTWTEYAGNPIVKRSDNLKCIVGTHAVIWNPSESKNVF